MRAATEPIVRAECCEASPNRPARSGTPVVALVGAPNCGKSTLFNGLTGLKSKTGNWPGTSVDVARGPWDAGADRLDLVDLPGAYSLDALSPDEALTRDLLLGTDPAGLPDVVVVVADSAHLARSLYLVTQVRELSVRCIVALTMNDVAAVRGLRVDPDALGAALGCPVVAVDARRRSGLEGLGDAVDEALRRPVPAARLGASADADELAREDERFTFIDAAVRAGVQDSGQRRVNWSDRLDRFATHRVWGPLLFLIVMWLVFQATTSLAAPLQDALNWFFSGPVSDAASSALARVGLGGSWVEGLIVNGLIAGVGMLLTFIPLMTIMFALLALLEDSGYMARAAVVTDRLMRTIGLPGKAFLPLIVGFGCNVPAISATRILTDARHRVLTALLVPFTSCTARLTVYVMLASTFFGRDAGTVVFVMYVTSILFVVGVGLLLRSTLWRTMGSEPLLLDLPPYQRPTLALTASATWVRLRGFLRTASGIIVLAVCVVWLLQSIPVGGIGGVDGGSEVAAFGHVSVDASLYAAAARLVAPIFAPAGFGAWQLVSALVVGFVAKEAVLTSWAQTYAVQAGDDGHLGAHLTETFTTTSGGHVLPAVAAFMVFVLAYTPCVATLAAQRREIGLRWTLFGLGIQLVIAWLASVIVFQVGALLW